MNLRRFFAAIILPILITISTTTLTAASTKASTTTRTSAITKNPATTRTISATQALTSDNHPRLFFTDNQMKQIVKDARKGKESYAVAIHENIMKMAEKYGLNDNIAEFERGKGKTFLETARNYEARFLFGAYAYRATKDKDYLRAVETNIADFCDNFESWNTGYFLENAEAAFGIALAYDWLYKELSAKSKEKVLDFLQTHCFDACLEGTKQVWFYGASNNWNHVCNSGMVIAALATYETNPEQSQALLDKSILSNPKGMEGVYAPDGASYEGPGYWNFATLYEAYMLIALKDILGSEFGLADSPGFDKGGLFRAFSIGNTGLSFNYADSGTGAGAVTPFWYYAWRFGQTGLLYSEIKKLEDTEKEYGGKGAFLALACALRLDKFEPKPIEDKFFFADGKAPVVIVRSGWEKQDAYLGIKGGSPKVNHGHMDEGGFVYEYEGIRWAEEMGGTNYETYRIAIRNAGIKDDLFSLKETSPRWYVFHINNRQHNTLTVNDRNQKVDGFCRFTEKFDTDERRGATIDLTPVYSDDLADAKRTLCILDGDKLEIKDAITAAKDAHVRFTFVTKAKVQVGEDGIVLSKGSRKMKLSATGTQVSYKQFNSNGKLSGTPIASSEKDNSKIYSICGFEYDVPAGGSAVVTTTLSKQ